MTKLHLQFKNQREETVQAAERLFEARPWSQSQEAQRFLGQEFLNSVCSVYSVPIVEFAIDINSSNAYFPSSPQPSLIVLKKFSVLALFKYFRMHLLEQGYLPAGPDDTQAWACSLFYRVRPVMFRARAREGRIPGVTARDTYTDETWARLEAAGLTVENFLVLDDITMDDLARVEAGEITVEDIVLVEETPEPTPEEASDVNPEFENLKNLNRDMLRSIAASLNLPGRGRMSKDQMVQALWDAGYRLPVSWG